MTSVRGLLFVAVVALAGATCAHSAEHPTGARVLSIWPGFEGALHRGDVVSALRPSGTAEWTPVRDPFDALTAEARWSRLIPLEVRVGDATRRLPMDLWGIEWSPAPDVAGLREALTLSPVPDPVAYCARLDKLRANVAAAAGERTAAWLDWRCALTHIDAGDLPAAQNALKKVHAALREDRDARLATSLFLARQAAVLKQLDSTRAILDQALGEAQGVLAPIEIQARDFHDYAAAVQSRYAEADAGFERLFASFPPQFAGTVLEAYALADRGFALRQLERFPEAEQAYRRALSTFEAHAPDNVGAASAHLSFGMLLRAQGDAAGALQHVQRAVDIYRARALAPRLASALNNLSLILWDGGDYLQAEALQSEALAISEKLAPRGYDVAVSLQNLSAMALDRGELALARSRQEESQAIFERVAPHSTSLALGYHTLARLQEAGDPAAARQNYMKALALWRDISPGSLREAWTLHNLGGMARAAGNIDQARSWFEQALAIRSKVAPGGQDEARGLESLGDLELQAGNFDAAARHLAPAVASFRRLAPGSEHLAVALHSMGELANRRGDRTQARALFCEAATVLDAQRQRVSASRERQAEYAARHARIPRDCAMAQIDSGAPEAALEVLERARARALRERMGDRLPAIEAAALPEALRAQRRALAANRARLEATQGAMAADATRARREALQVSLRAAEADERAWFERVAAIAPRYAFELHPRARPVADILERLPPDTAALVFVLGEADSRLLVVANGRVDAATLTDARAGIEARVANLRADILRRAPIADLKPELHSLYRDLVAPAAATLEAHERWLVVADGELALLPFSALVDDEGRFVAETHELAHAASVSLALDNTPPAARASPRLVAAAITAPQQIEMPEGAVQLPATPNTQREVAAIARRYPGVAQVFVDDEASEGAVREAASRATIVHLAAHSWLDSRQPLDSSLLLARHADEAAPDDGVVHAWEIMSEWQLDAQLVVLSACDSGSGQVLQDEGLLGLTRAFQYAGAHAVVATLWPVEDTATAAAMSRFHQTLAKGRPAAAAIVRMQRDFIRHSDAVAQDATRGIGAVVARGARPPALSHPFYWAAFELFGQLP
jgi:CHAT domain-containing protein